ncbi:hypothetical protein GCM10010156_23370 [Planobispora rosea]|uniref:DUF1349 domain-containing protein n=1 Tax=Planobispora rosea TaxID=35762 RepID=A0A8J3S228_PLARO|nr:DUF1349 domain-containing protein [Planobispora rosea]GGS63649.1 hypothetical protein GCM10010156_23370 [Planobispora rosea]GIH84501.1 hypothetical protein Pro02_29090 [Planobispora rosea]
MAFEENHWIDEPATWSAADGELRFVCEAATDLWRTTHYGYVRDRAPMFGREVAGDVRLTVTFGGDYSAQYDQAGAVLRADEENWIKAGTEFVDGGLQLSVVVTRGASDWSVTALPVPAELVTIELTRSGDAVVVRYGLDGAEPVTMLRLAYFPPGVPAFAGAMAAAPDGKGFEARFTRIDIEEGDLAPDGPGL